MKCDRKYMCLYAVTDRSWINERSLYQQVEDALKGGVTCVQLREKELGREEFLTEALGIAALCRKYQVPFIINDNVEIAIRCKADGVHVGQEDMNVSEVRRKVGNEMIIGVSVHSVKEAEEAVENGADYLGAGAVFPTATKTDASVLSHDILKEICASVDVPVVAIGGITKHNMEKLKDSGVDGVALVSAIFGAENIEKECVLLRLISEKMVNKEVEKDENSIINCRK